MPTPAEIKKVLVAAGLEIYRTRGDVVHLAERVRENLLMDSGIFVHAAESKVGFVVRAQRTDFPNDGEDRLFERARDLAAPALARGFREVNAEVRKIFDPGDANRTLDTWCELSYEKPVPDLEAAVDEVKFALTLEKAASR
jgi:hypothetical protein